MYYTLLVYLWFVFTFFKISQEISKLHITPVGINRKVFVDSNSWMFLLVDYCIEILRGSVGTPWWRVLINILSKSSKIVYFIQICYTFMSCNVIHYLLLYFKILIISQLLSKTCKVLVPRSGKQVCAIQLLCWFLQMLFFP